jgi:hypothetical protein
MLPLINPYVQSQNQYYHYGIISMLKSISADVKNYHIRVKLIDIRVYIENPNIALPKCANFDVLNS